MDQQDDTIYEDKIYFAGIPQGQDNFIIGLNVFEIRTLLGQMGLKGVKLVKFLPDAQYKYNSGFGEIICQDFREVVKFLPFAEKILF